MSIHDRIGVVESDVYNSMDGTVGTKFDFEIGIPKKDGYFMYNRIIIRKYDPYLWVVRRSRTLKEASVSSVSLNCRFV